MKTIQLTPKIEKFVEQQVKTGKYPDVLAVIQEGLDLLEERDRIYQGRFEELKQKVLIGVEELRRGEGIDVEKVFEELENDIQQIDAKVIQ